MFLTRLGSASRMVINGDPSQVDLPRDQRSGLAHAVDLLTGVQGVDVVYLDSEDVVRHPLVARIIKAYDAEAAREREAQPDRPRSRRPGS